MDISKFSIHPKKIAFWLSLSLVFSANAQEPNSSYAILIASDSSTISGLFKGEEIVSTHYGNVRLTQGSLEITGNEAVVTMSSTTNEIIHALVTGNPVYFERSSELAETEATGHSESIEYKVSDALVVFEGEVSFLQPGISYQCDRLLYRVESDLVEATGGCQFAVSN